MSRPGRNRQESRHIKDGQLGIRYHQQAWLGLRHNLGTDYAVVVKKISAALDGMASAAGAN